MSTREQLPQIRAGQQVDITADSLPNRTLHGHVDSLNLLQARRPARFPYTSMWPNPGMRLLPGMFVNATFVSRAAQPSIVVPRSAVLDTGTRKIVYLARPNASSRRARCRWARPTEDLFPVSGGLALGDKVVLNGAFLIDSQAHLSSGMSGLYGGSKEFAAGQKAQPASASTSNSAEPSETKLTFHADAIR